MSLVRAEYPRPHFDRSHAWLSLNGSWDFRADPTGTATPESTDWPQQITVPFAWETEASGIGMQWVQTGWYHRTIEVPRQWHGQRIVLHFGAVHHFAEVWVDGTRVGQHEGGYTPFEFDITDAVGEHATDVLVRVHAPNDKRDIVHGKQRSIPRDDYDDCAFTASSGIWQPVWLEARPATYLSHVALTPTAGLDGIDVRVEVAGAEAVGAQLTVTVAGQAAERLAVLGPVTDLTIPIATPRLWTPTEPQLYDVLVELSSPDGDDRVVAHTGLRRIETRGNQLWFNGERLYVRGVLDQGYWPGTGITAPDDLAFVTDLELARAAGFNLVRKHLKLEDPRFLYHADRLGMLVWAEPASTGRWSAAGAGRFEAQIEPMVRRDVNHPCIVIWGLYNEEWGLDWDVPGEPARQEAVRRAFATLKTLDPTRPAVDNSGWSHVVTDLVDWHIYDETPAGWSRKVHALVGQAAKTFPVGLGPGRIVEKRLFVGDRDTSLPNLNSEFGGGKTPVERGWNLRWQTLELRRYDQLCGYVWTELYDIEYEMAGVYYADRLAKDNGGSTPGHTNAHTVVLPELVPVAPGRDLVSADGRVSFDVRVSHHGSSPLDGEIAIAWGSHLVDLPTGALLRADLIERVKVEPFVISDAVRIATKLPDGNDAARLHVVVLVADRVQAVTAVDVMR